MDTPSIFQGMGFEMVKTLSDPPWSEAWPPLIKFSGSTHVKDTRLGFSYHNPTHDFMKNIENYTLIDTKSRFVDGHIVIIKE